MKQIFNVRTHTHTKKEKKGRDCVKRAAVAGDGKAF